jgi:hypothetical protein
MTPLPSSDKKPGKLPREYIIVSDKTSKVIFSGDYADALKMLSFARKCDGEVTLFKALRK